MLLGLVGKGADTVETIKGTVTRQAAEAGVGGGACTAPEAVEITEKIKAMHHRAVLVRIDSAYRCRSKKNYRAIVGGCLPYRSLLAR